MQSCPTQAVLPWVGLAADKVIRNRYNTFLDEGMAPPAFKRHGSGRVRHWQSPPKF
ncbi:MAG: hypothetical protein ACODAD_05775 [Planctomycetota bacterium]